MGDEKPGNFGLWLDGQRPNHEKGAFDHPSSGQDAFAPKPSPDNLDCQRPSGRVR